MKKKKKSIQIHSLLTEIKAKSYYDMITKCKSNINTIQKEYTRTKICFPNRKEFTLAPVGRALMPIRSKMVF